MAEQQQSKLQKEQQALQKPLGLRRPLAWIFFMPVLLAFLVLPFMAMQYPEFFRQASIQASEKPQAVKSENMPMNAHPSLQISDAALIRTRTAHALDNIWNPGPLASAHSNLEGDCKACHAGDFSRVKDESCTVCHSNMGLHVQEKNLQGTSFEEGRCASCHRDHKGRESLAEQNRHFVGKDCAACHAEIKTVAPETETLAVKDFAGPGHPAFRITVATGPEPTDLRRIRMMAGTSIVEKTSLKFPHDVHLDPKGINSPSRKVVMNCANCHEPADTRTGFKPITMGAHCQECHKLNFEPALPDRQVPHGPVDKVLSTVEEFYSYLALHPEERNKVNMQRAVLRARPGEENPNRSNLQNLSGNPRAQAAFAAVELFEHTACAVCHEVKAVSGIGNPKTSGSRMPQYKVTEISPPHPWMPMAEFRHKAHEFEKCSSCHKAAGSKNASDVLMPAIDNCQSCHAGSKPVLNKVQSDCGMCHDYHVHPRQAKPTSAVQKPEVVLKN